MNMDEYDRIFEDEFTDEMLEAIELAEGRVLNWYAYIF